MSNSSATPWTVTHQAPVSVGCSRQESGVGCHFLLQGIFPTREANPCLLHWQVDALLLSHPASRELDGRCLFAICLVIREKQIRWSSQWIPYRTPASEVILYLLKKCLKSEYTPRTDPPGMYLVGISTSQLINGGPTPGAAFWVVSLPYHFKVVEVNSLLICRFFT